MSRGMWQLIRMVQAEQKAERMKENRINPDVFLGSAMLNHPDQVGSLVSKLIAVNEALKEKEGLPSGVEQSLK